MPQSIRVPRGKRVRFQQGQDAPIPDLDDVDIILEEDLTLSLSSNFSQLVGGGANRGVSMLGQLVENISGFGFTGQFKQMGYQIWEGTDPLSLSITVGFYMKTNALKDVIRPAKALIKLPLPNDPDDNDEGLGLQAPGPSVFEALDDGENGSDALGKRLSCRIGFVNLPNVIVKNAEPTFSSEVDSNGYPIWASIKLDISSIFTATTQLIDQFGYGEE